MAEKATLKSTFKAYFYLLPALVILGLFNLVPIFRSFQMAFWDDYNFITREAYTYGTQNFVRLWEDTRFWLALGNTARFVLVVVPLQILIALGISLLLNRKIKAQGLFRSIYFLPSMTSLVAISMVWQFIFHTNHGLLNGVLSFFGFAPIPWLTRPEYALPALMIMSIWRGLGFCIVVLLAGLQKVDKGLYLAAKVDGARSWQQFKTVTLPALSPTLLFVVIVSVIQAFRIFTEVFSLFQGEPGPAGSTLTMVFYIWQAFHNRQLGLASAATVVLFVVIFIMTLIQLYIGKKIVHE